MLRSTGPLAGAKVSARRSALEAVGACAAGCFAVAVAARGDADGAAGERALAVGLERRMGIAKFSAPPPPRSCQAILHLNSGAPQALRNCDAPSRAARTTLAPGPVTRRALPRRLPDPPPLPAAGERDHPGQAGGPGRHRARPPPPHARAGPEPQQLVGVLVPGDGGPRRRIQGP